jgi:hypothetical protein
VKKARTRLTPFIGLMSSAIPRQPPALARGDVTAEHYITPIFIELLALIEERIGER